MTIWLKTNNNSGEHINTDTISRIQVELTPQGRSLRQDGYFQLGLWVTLNGLSDKSYVGGVWIKREKNSPSIADALDGITVGVLEELFGNPRRLPQTLNIMSGKQVLSDAVAKVFPVIPDNEAYKILGIS